MSISDSQKTTIANWLAEGDSLGEIQTKLKEELGLSMTFMETRFLIDDLNLELKKEDPIIEDDEDKEPENVEVIPEGVSLEVDTIVTPGAIVSGSVTFSDGVNAKWHIDQMGRLGLTGVEEGYQPSPEDVQVFQTALQEELQKKGMA